MKEHDPLCVDGVSNPCDYCAKVMRVRNDERERAMQRVDALTTFSEFSWGLDESEDGIYISLIDALRAIQGGEQE